MSNTLIWLGEQACQDPRLTGNKAAVLSQLAAKGYNVPLGFCLPIDFFELGSDGPAPLNPHDLQPVISDALAALPGPWVARSSSTAEDSKSRSFAGLFRSVLGLTAVKDVSRAISDIADSAQSIAIYNYAQNQGVALHEIGVAVLIQNLVIPQCAGVAFSRHPISGLGGVVIEATHGFADILVDGSISPDLVEVSADGVVTVTKIGSKKLKSVFLSGAMARIDTLVDEQLKLVLSESEAKAIARLAIQLENEFGVPQDIEWAISHDSLYVIQSRPITSIRDM